MIDAGTIDEIVSKLAVVALVGATIGFGMAGSYGLLLALWTGVITGWWFRKWR